MSGKLDFSILNLTENKRILNLFQNSFNKKHSNLLEGKSALDLYKEELVDSCILSYNEKFDEILKQVIISKKIIEFTGHFEATNSVCLELCISVQLPKSCGGCAGEAFYIDTNGNFSSEKIRELASNFIEEYSTNLEEFNIDFILNHIYYTRIRSAIELMACFYELERFVMYKNIRLIVIDSITYVLKQIEVCERFRVTNRIFQILRYISNKYNMSIIITNFCTTRINGDEAYTVASFGDSFYHMVNSRILFTKNNSMFSAKLTKNLMKAEKEINFKL